MYNNGPRTQAYKFLKSTDNDYIYEFFKISKQEWKSKPFIWDAEECAKNPRYMLLSSLLFRSIV